MSNPQSWYLTYTSTLPSKNNKIAVVAAMEEVVLKKEAKNFSLKCRSQLLANEVSSQKLSIYVYDIFQLFPPKNDCRKFQEQCKLNFFFPDVDNIRVAEITKQRRLDRKKMMLKKAASTSEQSNVLFNFCFVEKILQVLYSLVQLVNNLLVYLIECLLIPRIWIHICRMFESALINIVINFFKYFF